MTAHTITATQVAEIESLCAELLDLLESDSPRALGQLRAKLEETKAYFSLRTRHSALKALGRVVGAVEDEITVRAARNEARQSRRWARYATTLHGIGAGSLDLVSLPALVGNLEATVMVLQYSQFAYGKRFTLDRGSLYRTCGKPADFDEVIDAVLAPLGSDEAGLRDWGQVLDHNSNDGPKLKLEQVMALVQDPLAALEQIALESPWATMVAPGRATAKAFEAHRGGGNADRNAAAAAYRAVGTGDFELAAKHWGPLCLVWRWAVLNSIEHHGTDARKQLLGSAEGLGYEV